MTDDASKGIGDAPAVSEIDLRHADYQRRYYRERRKPRIDTNADAVLDAPPPEPRPSHTGYQPLIDFLAACPDPAISLTFARVEEIIGAALPSSKSALYAALVSRDDAPAVRQLRALGWRVRLSLRYEIAHFTRDARG